MKHLRFCVILLTALTAANAQASACSEGFERVGSAGVQASRQEAELRDEVARLRLAQDRGGPLSEREVETFARPLLQKATARLREGGVAFRPLTENGVSSLEILPGDQSRLNRIAKNLKSKFGVEQLVYDPSFLLRMDFEAAFLPALSGERAVSRIAMSHFGIAELGLDLSTAHEIIHAKHAKALLDSKDSPLHGEFSAIGFSRLPTYGSAEQPGYERALNLDEIETWRDSLWRALRKLRDSPENTRVEALESLQARSGGAEVVAQRAHATADLILRELEFGANPPEIRYEKQGQTLMAEVQIRQRTEGSLREGRVIARVPLLKSRGEQDPSNRELLLEYLLRYARLAERRERVMTDVYRELPRISQERDPERLKALLQGLMDRLAKNFS